MPNFKDFDFKERMQQILWGHSPDKARLSWDQYNTLADHEKEDYLLAWACFKMNCSGQIEGYDGVVCEQISQALSHYAEPYTVKEISDKLWLEYSNEQQKIILNIMGMGDDEDEKEQKK